MTNEEKILEMLVVMQKDITGIKEDISNLKEDTFSLKEGQQNIEEQISKLTENQVKDAFSIMELTYKAIQRLDGKLDLFNNRLFNQEADIQQLKRIK